MLSDVGARCVQGGIPQHGFAGSIRCGKARTGDFPTFNLGVNIEKANRSLSWTRDGVLLPAEDSATALYQKMFVQGDAAAVAQQLRRLDERGSILDTLQDEANRFNRKLGKADKARLDQYFTSVREVEQRLVIARE
ncbi:MAG: DUF1552 domain-containing protein [Acidobacteriota bacterium]